MPNARVYIDESNDLATLMRNATRTGLMSSERIKRLAEAVARYTEETCRMETIDVYTDAIGYITTPLKEKLSLGGGILSDEPLDKNVLQRIASRPIVLCDEDADGYSLKGNNVVNPTFKGSIARFSVPYTPYEIPLANTPTESVIIGDRLFIRYNDKVYMIYVPQMVDEKTTVKDELLSATSASDFSVLLNTEHIKIENKVTGNKVVTEIKLITMEDDVVYKMAIKFTTKNVNPQSVIAIVNIRDMYRQELRTLSFPEP